MKLYHGTTDAVAREALTAGLLPRSALAKRRGNWSSCPSHPDAVYLTDCYAAYFGLNSLDGDQRLRKGKEGAAIGIVEVDVARLNPWRLVPDEDTLEQGTRRGKDGLPEHWSMKRRTRHYRERLEQFADGQQWLNGLRAMGTCAHLGPIPAQAVTRVAIIDIARQAMLMFQAMNPTISIMNYRLCGHQYRDLTRWVFEEWQGPEAGQLASVAFQPPPHRDGITIIEQEER